MNKHTVLENRRSTKQVYSSKLKTDGSIGEVHARIFELIAGGGQLEPTLKAITDAVEDHFEDVACLICWRCCPEEAMALVASSMASSELTHKIGDVSRREFEEVGALCAETVNSDGGKQIFSRQINCPEGVQLGLIVVFGRRELNSEQKDVMTTLSANAGFAILTELRSRALGEVNERFAALAKNVPGVVYQRVVSANGDIAYSYISDAAEDLFGVSPSEILSDPQALFDCHGPEYYATFHDRLIEASKTLELWDVEATIYSRDGKRKFTHAIARPHLEPDGSVVWNGVILDQTRIKEAELAAAAAEARTRDAIIESIPQAFALFDANDRLVTWNSRFTQLYPELDGKLSRGATYAELVKAEIETGIDQITEDLEPQAHYYQRLAHHHQAKYTAERQVRNNRWILINEHRTSDGGTVVLHTDVTDFKKREFALKQSNLELEAFASIASHDLQEPLRKIDAFGSRLKKRYFDELGDDGQMYIDRMQSSVARMRELINDLLDYSRVTTQGKAPAKVDLEQIAQEVIGDLQILIENTKGKVEIKPLITLDADRTQIRQLLQNIIANALKFHKPDENPVVRIEYQASDPSKPSSLPGSLLISDNGIGFDMKYADRIFGIFQRLHGRSEYEGTGVGLATCRKIVERHGWTIRAESKPDHGTTFRIDIPSGSSTFLETE